MVKTKKIKWEFPAVVGVAMTALNIAVGVTVGVLIGCYMWVGATDIYLKALVVVTAIFVASWVTGFLIIGLAEITGHHSNLE